MRPKQVISPVDRKDRPKAQLTKDKVYDVLPDPDNLHSARSFGILADDGIKCFCLFEDCAHINNENWIIV